MLKALNQRPIAYYPIYRKITGSTTAGILLSQLMYWFAIKDRFHKTDAEIMQETLLTEKELRNAKARIKKLDFVTVSREGLPAKTYYEIDWDRYEKTLGSIRADEAENVRAASAERDDTDSPKGTNSASPKGQSLNDISLTETTTEITTENTTPHTPQGGTVRRAARKIDGRFLEAELRIRHGDDMPYQLNPEAFEEFVAYRRSSRHPSVSEQAARRIVKLLCKHPPTVQAEMIDKSIRNDYRGIFEPGGVGSGGGGSGPEYGSIGWMMQQQAGRGDVVDTEVCDD